MSSSNSATFNNGIMDSKPAQDSIYQEIKKRRTALAAGSSGILSVIIGHPFDTLKTRMQVSENSMTLKQSYKELVSKHGFFSLWRGVAGPLCVVSFLKAWSFSNYDASQRALMKWKYDEDFRLNEVPGALGWKSYTDYKDIGFSSKLPLLMMSGMIAGSLTVMLSGPLELIKVQLQLGKRQTTLQKPDSSTLTTKPPREGILSCTKRIYSISGPLGFYKGFVAHLIRDGFGTAVYFGGYETLKHLLQTTPLTSPLPFSIITLISGGLAGTLSWCALFPIDVVKSHLQKEAFLPPEYKRFDGSILKCIKTKYRESGIRTFYRGLPPTLLRALPIHALNFSVYENVSSFIDRL